jgi:hypothetical protein
MNVLGIFWSYMIAIVRLLLGAQRRRKENAFTLYNIGQNGNRVAGSI